MAWLRKDAKRTESSSGTKEKMIYKKLSLTQKIILLSKVILAKWKILKLVWVATPFELNDFAKEKLDLVEWEYLPFDNIRYKKIPDTTGEYRFYVPALSEDLAWRIDKIYSVRYKDKLPHALKSVALKAGLRDEDMYKEVWKI